MTQPVTVLLAEDHTIVREGLRGLLKSERDIEVIGEARTGREAVQMTRELKPAVVIMDIAMPLLNGLEATRQIRKELPNVKVIILSAHSDDIYVEQARALGAAGYLIKQNSAHSLAKAIRETQKVSTFYCPSMARRLKRRDLDGPRTKPRVPRLTSREVEVLQLIAEGLANKQIAAELTISIKTVEKHRQNLMTKLDIHDAVGLARYAIATGVIESGVRLKLE
jgi:DNA-binding NarL/FixJ family response regulator